MLTPDEASAQSRRPVALVTGASRGIGLAIAFRLAREGYDLILVARNAALLEELRTALVAECPGRRIDTVAVDLAADGGPERLLEEVRASCDRLEVLVNNVGVLHEARRVERLPVEDWSTTFRLNVEVPFLVTRGAKDLLTECSVVVNISSTAGRYPSVGLAAYCASKAALEMLTKVLALEWARDGIRVVGIMPGKVETDMVRPILRFAESREQQLNPLGRVGLPEEVAGLVAYLVSPEAAYVTGSMHAIDGGELLNHEM